MAIPAEKAVAMFIAARVRELYPMSTSKKKAPGEWSLQAIADDLGVTKPQVAAVLDRGSGVGPKFERQFAAKYYDGSVDQLRAAALAWAEDHVVPEPPQPTVDRAYRYDSLRVVVETPANKGRWSSAAIAAVREHAYDADEDPGEAHWTRALDAANAALLVGLPKLPTRGSPLDDVDAHRSRRRRTP